MSGGARLVRALAACYPAGWRSRYGDEYARLFRPFPAATLVAPGPGGWRRSPAR
jgi:hypothetical protein